MPKIGQVLTYQFGLGLLLINERFQAKTVCPKLVLFLVRNKYSILGLSLSSLKRPSGYFKPFFNKEKIISIIISNQIVLFIIN